MISFTAIEGAANETSETSLSLSPPATLLFAPATLLFAPFVDDLYVFRLSLCAFSTAMLFFLFTFYSSLAADCCESII